MDVEEKAMLAVMSVNHVSFRRPSGGVYFCFKSNWAQHEPSPRTKFQRIDNVAPLSWAEVRYFLERELGLHSLMQRDSSCFGGLLVTDYESRKICDQTELSDDCLIIPDDSVLILVRLPVPKSQPHYIPMSLIGEFRTWFSGEKSRMTKEKRKSTASRASVKIRRDERGFATSKFRFRNFDRVSAFAETNVHQSRLPPGGVQRWFACPRCHVFGVHDKTACDLTEEDSLIIPMKDKRLATGIPRSTLIELDPHSIAGQRAKLKDLKGRVFASLSSRVSLENQTM